MKKIKNILKFLFVLIVTLIIQTSVIVYADGESVNLTLKHNGGTVFSGVVALPLEGVVNINDQEVNARSVLNIIYLADDTTGDFNISDLTYYESFSAFYLKCITISGEGELCDNWMYEVNGGSPSVGMDQNILAGGEEVMLFFGESSEDVEEVVEDTADPIEEVSEEEDEPVVHSSGSGSGGSTSGSRPRVVSLSQSEQTPTPIVLAVPNESAQVLPVAPVLPKISPQKKVVQVPVVKVAESEKVLTKVDNTAVAVLAVEEISPVVEEKSWLRKFLSWIFGF